MDKVIKPLSYISPKQRRLFFNFLYSLQSPRYNNIVERYKRNYRNIPYYGSEVIIEIIKRGYRNSYPNHLVANSFNWSQTPEGVDFWRSIDVEWRKYVYKHNWEFCHYR